MDKILMHDCFIRAGLPVVEYKGFNKNNVGQLKEYVKKIGLPVFVKPSNGGSSIGITKVTNLDDLTQAVGEALMFDDQICLEKGIEKPREIEIAVLGNHDLTISFPGEVLSEGEFYSYETKYFNPFNTTTKAKLTDKQIAEFKKMAEKAYRATDCQGYARIDFLLDQKNKIYINEINTLPGFTSISMFPKLMADIGIGYKELITRIIELALE
jgi:D-alanine-D-alanine ligase